MAGQVSKPQRVQQILSTLQIDMKEKKLLPQDRLRELEELKIYSREAQGCEQIFAVEGIRTLSNFALDDTSHWETSREALRCLANSLLLSAASRQTFVDLGYAVKASERYSSPSLDDEFLLGRILLLTTYAKVDISDLVHNHNLAINLNDAIFRHSARYSKRNESVTVCEVIEELALTETLKLMYNVSHLAPNTAKLLEQSTSYLFNILCSRKLSNPPLQPPVTWIINALSNLEYSANETSIFPSDNPTYNVIKLMDILDGSLHKKYLELDTEFSFDDKGSVLLDVLRKVYRVAPEDVREYMRKRLLPTEEERDKPLGRGDTLSARLLNLTTAVLAPKARVIAGQLLFQLSESDPARFITNVGYGYALGFLLSNGIAIPQESLNRNAEVHGIPINPVTGQTLEAEGRDYRPLAEMSDDEKMKEAERLFVLFERLKKTGVINVKNPVEAAMEEGRFEELD